MIRTYRNLRLVLIITLAHLLISSSFAQTPPQKMSYQAVIRDATNELVTTQVGIQISIIQGTVDGTVVYSETQTPTPNLNGLITIEIGSGTIVSGDFATIDWAEDPYFIKTETDPAGGINYIISGTSQLLSVPYAFHANTVQNEIQDLSQVLSQGTNADNNQVVNVSQLGIGTATPEGQLHLRSTTDITVLLEADIDNSGENENPRIAMRQSGGLVEGGLGFAGDPGSVYAGSNANAMYLINNYNSDLQLGTDNTSRITITNNGTIDVEGNTITNTANPVNSTDAVTKSYFDNLIKKYIDILTRVSDPADLLAEGISVATLVTSGVTVSRLLSSGVTPSELFNAKVGVGTLEQNGVTEQALTDAGLIGTLTDVDGNVYKWVKIGTQAWMAENLKTTRYNDNTQIPLVTVASEWGGLTTPAYCWYNNDENANKATYGALYNWFVLDPLTNGNKNVCPIGWHVPTDNELATLTDYLEGLSGAGGKLKETGLTHWKSPNPATNESGFTALPGGLRGKSSSIWKFGLIGYYSGLWMGTETSAENSRSIGIYYTNSGLTLSSYEKKSGLTVRCLKD